MKIYNSACSSLRSGQLDRLVSKIKDRKPEVFKMDAMYCYKCGEPAEELYEAVCYLCREKEADPSICENDEG